MNHPSIESISNELRYMPLKAPFVTARGRTETARSVVVEMRASDGFVGYGAVTPAPYVTGETVDDVAASLTEMAEACAGADVWDHSGLFARLARDFPNAHAARAGLEIAVMDIFGQSIRQPLWRHWGARRTEVVTDLTVPINTLDEARAIAAGAAQAGMAHLKIKVDGTDPEASLRRIQVVHEAAPDAGILVDANQSFTAESALAFLAECSRNDLPMSLFEQPVDAKDIEGLVRVAKGSDYPVGADEAVVTPKNCWEVLSAGGVQVVNVKLMKSGIAGSLEIIRMCQEAGVTLMLGCMVESHIGIGAAVHLACGTGAFSYFDLDAPLLLAGDIADGSFELRGDKLIPGERPGLGARLSAASESMRD
ncbi:MAG TPA: dipeptide epimerase [Armatimonadota bacterium]|jgi:L-alanine-DL-glutamate epimerase-like enolase superfamily enzyme